MTPNARDDQGNTAFHNACKDGLGKLTIAKMILDNAKGTKIDLNSRNFEEKTGFEIANDAKLPCFDVERKILNLLIFGFICAILAHLHHYFNLHVSLYFRRRRRRRRRSRRRRRRRPHLEIF